VKVATLATFLAMIETLGTACTIQWLGVTDLSKTQTKRVSLKSLCPFYPKSGPKSLR
jgi:hypothetical protein